VELADVGRLRYGPLEPTAPDADSRAVWHRDGADLTLRVPWGMAGFADPSSRQVLVPRGTEATTVTSPGVTVVLSAGGTDQATGPITWEPWQAVHYRERLKAGAVELQQAFLATAP
jgi:hypothetical protein